MKNKFSRCFVACVLLLAATFAFSQGSTITGNPIAVNRAGQPISGASVAITSSNPCGSSPTYTNCGGQPYGSYTGALPPSNLITTSTDITLATPCTLNPVTLGLLAGSGCTNPGHTDGLGNVIAYSTGGMYFCTYYGSGLTASVQVCAFPFPTTVIYAFANETVAHAVARLPASGGQVIFATGTYPSGGYTCTAPNVWLQGSGMPNFNSATAPTALTGGTIIQGQVTANQGCDHLTVRDLGIDVGPTWINANNGGVATSGLAIFNNGQVPGAPQVQFPVVRNVAVLGYSLSASAHAMLIENVNGADIRNVNLIYNQHGLVIKGTNVNVDGVYSSGHSIDSAIAKSDIYAPSDSVNLSHVNINNLAAVGDTAGLALQASTASLLHVNVSDSNIRNTGNWGILLTGSGVSTSVSGVTIKGVNFDWSGTPSSGIDCIQYQSYVFNFNVSDVNCFNYGSGIIPNAPTSTMNDINIANSNFINLVGNAIEVYGRSTVTGNTLVTIGGNGIQSDNGTLLAANNILSAITGTAFNNSGGNILFNPLAASLTTTAAGSDNVAIPGMGSTGHCTLAPTNASAATNIATTYVSAKTTNQITVTHTATANMNYDIVCTPY